jgi:hypothetical protein
VEEQDAIRGFKVRKAPGTNSISNRALKHILRRALHILVAIFNEDPLAQYFPAVWKHTRIISTLKPVKDPALPLSHCAISLLDANCKLVEKILLSRILVELSGCGLLRDEQF